MLLPAHLSFFLATANTASNRRNVASGIAKPPPPATVIWREKTVPEIWGKENQWVREFSSGSRVRHFNRGWDCNGATIAARVGGIFSRGIGPARSPRAYSFRAWVRLCKRHLYRLPPADTSPRTPEAAPAAAGGCVSIEVGRSPDRGLTLATAADLLTVRLLTHNQGIIQ